MKSFYSLIKITPNEMSGDNLTIGLILSTPNGFKVKFSKPKKKLLRSIIDSDASIIDFIEREILNKINEHNAFIAKNSHGFFELSQGLNSDYFLYLSKYSNGILKFSTPSLIADHIDDAKFEKLFRLFVDNSSSIDGNKKNEKHIEQLFYEKVDNRLISRVKNRIHTNQTIDSNIVPSLFNPFQIDCIGLNGELVGAKALSFTQSKETLHKIVNTYISVIAQLSSKFSKSLDSNKFFLIADQPKQDSEVYKLWQQLFNDEQLLKVISADESGQVAELIEANGATKFLEI